MKSKTEIDQFITTFLQIDRAVSDFDTLSKKKADDPVNTFKIKLVNEMLSSANSLLGKKHRPFCGFELFTEDAVPSNSDVLVVLSQYRACLDKLRHDSVAKLDLKYFWTVNGKPTDIEAPRPSVSLLH
jgi:hypothetical protein